MFKNSPLYRRHQEGAQEGGGSPGAQEEASPTYPLNVMHLGKSSPASFLPPRMSSVMPFPILVDVTTQTEDRSPASVVCPLSSDDPGEAEGEGIVVVPLQLDDQDDDNSCGDGAGVTPASVPANLPVCQESQKTTEHLEKVCF